jgi:hypothetical protein
VETKQRGNPQEKKRARGTAEHIVSKQEKYKAHTVHETSHGRDRKMTTDPPKRTTAEQHTHEIPRVTLLFLYICT